MAGSVSWCLVRGTMSRVLRSGGGLGGCVEGLLLGDGGVFLPGRDGPGGGIKGVAVGGSSAASGSCRGSDTTESVRHSGCGAGTGARGIGVVVGCCSGSGARARCGSGAVGSGGLSGDASASGQRRDTGVEGAVLGDGGAGVPVGLEAGQAGGGGEGAAGERGRGDGGADRQGCFDRLRGVDGEDHGAGDVLAAGGCCGGFGLERRERVGGAVQACARRWGRRRSRPRVRWLELSVGRHEHRSGSLWW